MATCASCHPCRVGRIEAPRALSGLMHSPHRRRLLPTWWMGKLRLRYLTCVRCVSCLDPQPHTVAETNQPRKAPIEEPTALNTVTPNAHGPRYQPHSHSQPKVSNSTVTSRSAHCRNTSFDISTLDLPLPAMIVTYSLIRGIM